MKKVRLTLEEAKELPASGICGGSCELNRRRKTGCENCPLNSDDMKKGDVIQITVV